MKPNPNYNLVRKDRGNNIKGGGVAFLVSHDVPFQVVTTPNTLENDPHLEEITISVTSNKKDPLNIRNVYIPPASSCGQGYQAPIDKLTDGLGDSTLILGDVNAHHQLWHSDDTEDPRGRLIADWIGVSDLGILNEDLPTRVTATASTAPDLSIASCNIIPSCIWSVNTSLGSDHLPIHIKLSTEIRKIPVPNKTFINFKKADWENFTKTSEALFDNAPLNSNVHASEKFFRNIVNKAAKQNIPSGRIPNVLNAVPTETANLMKERDRIRKEDPADDQINILNTQINNSIKNHRKEKWLDHLNSCGPNTKKLWDTIKAINNPPKQPDNQSIQFNKKHYNDPKKIANKFNSQYTPGTKTKPTKEFRRLLRQIRKKSPDPEVSITTDMTEKAIKKAKNSKAMGPDNISPVMMKHLGPKAISYLTNIFNNVVNQATLPPMWKVGRIIPLLKPKKPADEGPSYRPISLLSPPVKILESIILAPIQESISLADHQHGFRKGRSTMTALQDITDHVKFGLNRQKPVNRTVMVAVDLSRAFDTVNHETLIKDIADLPLNNNIKCFLVSYLRGRQTYVEFRGAKSKHRKMRQGVPQGGVLSPVLFNLYMAKIPTPPANIKLVTYADDSTVLCSGPKIEPLCLDLNIYLTTLNEWFKERNLEISAPKSSATLFTTFSNEVSKELPIHIDGSKVPTLKNPKILGVTLDPLLTFKAHADLLKVRVNSRTNILKALAGSSWGMDTETLLTTYSATSKSLLSYCAPVWTPTLSDTNFGELQVAQNHGLRAALGCVKASHIDHLHAEAKIMPVKDHCTMLTKQFLLSTTRPTHPNHSDINTAPPRRIMKPSMLTRFAEDIRPLAPTGISDDINYKEGLKTLHTSSVQATIAKQSDNAVLGTKAPKVNKSETILPRKTRTILSQLRSGYSSHLNTFLNTINPTKYPSRDCPKCNQNPHETPHLFNCPADPTNLTPRTLWEDPPAAAAFLGLEVNQGAADLDDND